MDECRFEGLTRQIGAARDRRTALRILVGTAVAAIPAIGFAGDEAAASLLTKGCRNVGQRCNDDKDCCGGSKCQGKRCKCIKKGKSCLIVVDEELGITTSSKALCCSAKCSKGRGKCK